MISNRDDKVSTERRYSARGQGRYGSNKLMNRKRVARYNRENDMKKVMLVLSVLGIGLLNGCAVTRDGITIPGTATRPDATQLVNFTTRNGLKSAEPLQPGASVTGPKAASEVTKQLIKESIKTDIFTDDPTAAGRNTLIAIGNTMSLGELSGKELETNCSAFEAAAGKLKVTNAAAGSTSPAWCRENVVGIASVKYWSVPLIASKFMPAVVTREMRQKVYFPS